MNSYKKYRADLEPGKFYHVYNRSIGQIPIFISDRNRNFFLKRFRDFLFNYVETWAWVLMGNHFHFAIRVREEKKMLEAAKNETTVKAKLFCEEGMATQFLEDQFKRLFSSYAQAFNKETGRTGSLFEKGFRRLEVTNSKYLLQLIHYIHNNPVHHGFVTDAREWAYSSYRTIFSEKETSLNRQQVQSLFEGKEEFEQLHNNTMKYDVHWQFLDL